jgi:aerobic-type carbon monoxide dehydrogenase small subunit (CoxS/CutS family)
LKHEKELPKITDIWPLRGPKTFLEASFSSPFLIKTRPVIKRKEVVMVFLNVNGKNYKVDVPDDMPLLWVIRDYLKLTGTKFGCGIGECGACTVHINGKAERSCSIPVKEAQGKKITTIEGLPKNHPVKRAWIQEQVAQCGYCQPGVIMQISALLSETRKPDAEKIINAMDNVICRCGTYARIKKGIRTAVQIARKEGRV